MENEVKKEETIVTEHPANTQVYNIIVSKDPSWQSIIYDLEIGRASCRERV